MMAHDNTRDCILEGPICLDPPSKIQTCHRFRLQYNQPGKANDFILAGKIFQLRHALRSQSLLWNMVWLTLQVSGKPFAPLSSGTLHGGHLISPNSVGQCMQTQACCAMQRLLKAYIWMKEFWSTNNLDNKYWFFSLSFSSIH